MDERQCRTGGGKLRPHRRQAIEQAMPRGLAFLEPQLPCERRHHGGASAGEAVVEPQDPNPPARKHLVHGRIVDRIRHAGLWPHCLVPPGDALEVRVEPFGRRQPLRRRLVERQQPMKRATRAAGVDDESRGDDLRDPVARQVKARAPLVEVDAVDACLVQQLRAGLLRLDGQELVERGSIPVRVGDVVVRAGRDQQLARVRAIVVKGPARRVVEETEPALQPHRQVRDTHAARCPTSTAAPRAAGRTWPPVPRAACWPAASTIPRSRSADDAHGRSARRTARPGAAPTRSARR